MPYARLSPLELIPADAIYVFETDEPMTQWDAFSKSSFWTYMKQHPYLAELTADAEYLDSLIIANAGMLKAFGDRHFIVSAHMTEAKNYDFLFAFDLKRSSRVSLSMILNASLSKDDYEIIEQEFRGKTIIAIKNLEDHESLYLYKRKNYLLCSYTLNLIQASIDQEENRNLNTVEEFNRVYTKVGRKGLGQFYFNFSLLDEYLCVYFTDQSALIKQISKEFSFCGLDLKLGETDLSMTGLITFPADSGYMHLLQQYGNGKPNAHQVLSNRTAYHQSILLKDVESFYAALLELRESNNADLFEYKKLKLKVEKVLQLNLEEDFLSWIGDEITVAQLSPNRYGNAHDQLVLMLKANDIGDAQTHLAKIQKQIKKRTPAVFKQLSYKGQAIYYLDIKGFFNLFLGKTFNKISKPYYTVIGAYVIFSNSPKTLVGLIEDYQNGNTLANNNAYLALMEELDNRLSLFTYANGPMLFPVLNGIVQANQQQALNQNKGYLQYFSTLAVTLRSSNAGFSTSIHSNFTEPVVMEENAAELDSLYRLYVVESGSLAHLGSDEAFVLDQIDNGTYKMYYPNGSKRIVAKVKNGLLNGSYEEYYENGKPMAEGKYKKGKKTGKWKYYSEEGDVTEQHWD